MGKLMKYEFRKQLMTKWILLAIFGLLEIYFFIGLFSENNSRIGRSIIFLVLFTMLAVFFVSVECIFTYYSEMKSKQSYMLFMVPKSLYEVMGAKVACACIQILLSAVVIGGVAIADICLLVAKMGNIQELIDMLKSMLELVFKLDIDYALVVVVLLGNVFSYASTTILAFFAITLALTFMANRKFSGFISGVLFIVISMVVSKIKSLIIGNLDGYPQQIVGMLLAVAFGVLFYFGTSWMLKKKVNV